jgi:hypothetical protein
MLWLKKFWYNGLGQSTPWVDAKYDATGLVVRAWNQAYVGLASTTIPAHARKDWDETTLVKNYMKDPNKKYAEAPRLDIVHMGLERDGIAKVKLDWNTEFILHLADNGISAETEEEAVQLYLQMLTAKKFDEFSEIIEENFKDFPEIDEVDGEVTGGAGEQFDTTVGDDPVEWDRKQNNSHVRHTNRRKLDR